MGKKPITKETKEFFRGTYSDENFESNNLEIIELKSEIEQMKQQLAIAENNIIKQEKFAALGELSSRLSHDIKNPLAIICTTVFLLKKNQNEIDRENLRKLEMVERSALKIQYLVDNLLDFVRFSKPHYENVSLLELIKESISSFNEHKKIKFFLPKNDMILRCDSHQMEVIFKNLILNSIQSIGDVQGCITVRFQEEEQSNVISIIDSGPGIPKKLQTQIFDPLFTTKKHGTGLGLASCKSIVESHNGKITFLNNPSTFTIEIPKK